MRRQNNTNRFSKQNQLPRSNRLAVERVSTELLTLKDRPVKKIGKRAIASTKVNLEKYGQLVPIIVSDTLKVLHGEEFLIAAKELGWSQVEVIRLVDLAEIDQRIVSIYLKKLPELSTWDDEALRIEFNDLQALDLDIDVGDLTGFQMGEIDVILDPSQVADRADPLDQVPDFLPQVITRPGDLWILGKHRLLCADARTPQSYKRLMAGETARMVLTDPPYNIPIANNVSGLGKTKHENFEMAVGEMSFDEFADFLQTMLQLSSVHLCNGGLLFTFMDRRHLEELFLAGREAELSVIDLCFWDKMSGGMGSFYRSQHEPCLIFKTGKAPFLSNVELGRQGRYRTNVWTHRGLSSFGRGRQEALNDHPTVKPVNLLAEAIKDTSKRGDIVLDPFAGSGSTIIAADKTRRIGYGKIGFVPYSPLGRGFLTGRIKRPEELSDNDFRRQSPRFTPKNFERNLALVAKAEEVARAKQCPASQVALAWVLARGEDIVPVPGTRRVKYLEENIGVLKIELTADELQDLEAAFPLGVAAGERYSETGMQRVNL